jgi:aminoglycoside phosphotransferase (APT) family kinase protein
VRNAVPRNNASTPAMSSEIERHYDEAKRQTEMAAQEAYHKDWEARHLAQHICPWSGEPLTVHGDGAPGNLSCVLCDCFGYKPDEVGKK